MDYNVVKENLNKKSSEDLIRILKYSQDDYTPEAINIIKTILSDKGILSQVVNDADKNYQHLKANIPVTNSQSRITKPVKVLLYILSIITFGLIVNFKNEIMSAVLRNIVKTSQEPTRGNVWTSKVEAEFRSNLLQSPLLKNMQEKYKSPFCDCFIKNIEDRYPTGSKTSIPQLVKDTVVGDCAEYVKKNIH